MTKNLYFKLFKFYKKLNNLLKIYLKKNNLLDFLENIQIIVSLFGILYGLVFFFYFYIKINRLTSYLFILTIVIGIYVYISTRREILNGTEKIQITTKQI